jgi:hypothetical protein
MQKFASNNPHNHTCPKLMQLSHSLHVACMIASFSPVKPCSCLRGSRPPKSNGNARKMTVRTAFDVSFSNNKGHRSRQSTSLQRCQLRMRRCARLFAFLLCLLARQVSCCDAHHRDTVSSEEATARSSAGPPAEQRLAASYTLVSSAAIGQLEPRSSFLLTVPPLTAHSPRRCPTSTRADRPGGERWESWHGTQCGNGRSTLITSFGRRPRLRRRCWTPRVTLARLRC